MSGVRLTGGSSSCANGARTKAFGLATAFFVTLFAAGHGHAQLPCGYEYDIVYGPQCGNEGPANTNVRGISEQGDIVGGYHCSGGQDRAWVGWDAAGFTALTGMPPGTFTSYGDDVQNGVIVGEHQTSSPPTRFAFRWEEGLGVSLGTIRGGLLSTAYAVNSFGVIVGDWGGAESYPRAFRWENGVMHDISIDLPLPRSRARDIADNGAITGFMTSASAPFEVRPFIWHDGKVTDLGLMPGSFASEGWAINNRNQVVGVGLFKANNVLGYIRRGFLWDNGEFTDLGTLPGYEGVYPYGINDHGTVAGAAQSISGISTAIVWNAGVLRAMADYLPPHIVGACVDINNQGEIAFLGLILQSPQPSLDVGIRLRPIPRKPGDVNCDQVVGVADLLAVIAHWNQSGVEADINGSGFVDLDDILFVVMHWG